MSTRTRSTTTDGLRIAWAVLRLEWWLEWYGAPSSSCRPMRRELAANLRETASEPGGVRDGVRRLGSLRELAREAAVDTGRFRWERGLVFAVVAFAVLVLGQLALSLAFVEGLLAGGGGEGRFLGTEVSASDDGSSAFSVTLGGWVLLVVPLVFVLVSKPWRLARRLLPA